MNLLSIGAAFGVLVAVFQWGWAGPVFGVNRAGPDRGLPSGDAVRDPLRSLDGLRGLPHHPDPRGVALISADNRTAVRKGVAATGKTITAAALIMILIFGSFILGGERVIKEFGLGPGGRHPHGRGHHPDGDRAVADVPLRQGQLVVPRRGSTGPCPTCRSIRSSPLPDLPRTRAGRNERAPPRWGPPRAGPETGPGRGRATTTDRARTANGPDSSFDSLTMCPPNKPN